MKPLKSLFTTLALVLFCGSVFAQLFTLTGRITDESNQPVIGASISVKGTERKTTSGVDGRYAIQVRKGETLVFSFLGMKTQQIKVGGSTIDVQFASDGQALEDVVVVAYGTAKRKDLTGSLSTITQGTRVAMVADRSRVNAPAPAQYEMSYNATQDEEYASMKENRFVNVSKDPLSTFALEVDGASYSNMRRMVSRGMKPEKEAIRVEEFLNYFSYAYEKPQGNDPVKISYEVGACPWNAAHKLVRIGVKAREIPSDNLPATNFVFLVDVSGSMWEANRLPLVQSSLKLLVNNLRANDRVAIVTYAGAAGLALPSTSGSDKQKIREALDELRAGGSTAGGEGIRLAYKIARQHFIPDGNNRIILATDGDFNVGVSSAEGLESLIEQERKSGIFLTVLGYGMGNYKDKKLQVLAEKGNGNYAYIDNLQEANKVLVGEFGGTMYTVAKDVKLQVEFNPARVQSFRLVGYESRLLQHEDFNDDTKDAGEIGAGHSVTALYEIVPAGAAAGPGSIDPLKYQPHSVGYPKPDLASAELMNIKLRYKTPDGEVSRLVELPVKERPGVKLSEDFRFASAVAMFGQLLRDSDFKGDATYDRVIALAREGLSEDPHGYRREMVRLAETVKGMAQE